MEEAKHLSKHGEQHAGRHDAVVYAERLRRTHKVLIGWATAGFSRSLHVNNFSGLKVSAIFAGIRKLSVAETARHTFGSGATSLGA